MRKIDKSVVQSTQYKSWEEVLENDDRNHGVYNSSTTSFTKML